MSYETDDKMVSHPDHYKAGKFEIIDVREEVCKDLSGVEAICTDNALRYICRWKKKNGVQDVKKAIWYLQHLVDHLENKERAELLTKQLRGSIENSTYGLAIGIDDDPGPIKCVRSSSGVYIPEPRTEHNMVNNYIKLQEENADLRKKYDKLYKEYCHVRSVISPEDADNFVNLDAEFEETVMGELLNLKSVKRHLESINSVCNDPDLEYAYQIVKKDILNLEKFVAERWGNNEEEESKCSE